MVRIGNQDISVSNDSILNSSNSHSLRGSINHAKTNKILMNSFSTYYTYEGIITFSTSILRKYENILKGQSIQFEMPEDYFYKPEYLSYVVYGTTDLWYLILFLNGMTKPDQFKQTTINIFNPDSLEILNNIVEKEKANVNNSTAPINIKRELIKDLNQPSKRIVSSLYDKKIKPMVLPEKQQNLFAITDFNKAFTTNYSSTIRHKLMKKNYTILDKTGTLVSLLSSDLTNEIKLDELNTEGFPNTWKKNFRQEFEGYIYIDETLDYEFKPVIVGNSKMWIDDVEIFSIASENYTINENIFETASKNSDFKKNNTDGWIVENSALRNDPLISRNVLYKRYENTQNGSNLATVKLDVSKIKTYEDLALTTKYKSVSNLNVLFSGAVATVTYSNGQTEIFKNNSQYSHFNNNGNYLDVLLVVSFQKGLTLKSLDVTFPVERKPVFNQLLNGEISISEFKAQPFRNTSKVVNLIGERWHKFKFRYDMIEQSSSYLKLMYKVASSNIYLPISSDIVAFSPNTSVTEKSLLNTVRNQFFSYDGTEYYTETLDNSNTIALNDNQPDKLFVPSNINFMIKQNSILSIMANRKYRIVGNTEDDITVYKNGNLWFKKNKGTNIVEKPSFESAVQNNANIELSYKHIHGNGDLSFKFEVFPDENGNQVWGEVVNKNSYILDSNSDNWFGNGNNIQMKGYSSGISTYLYTASKLLSDYRIKTYVDIDNVSYYGSIGIMFRIVSSNEYYLYVIKRNGQSLGIQQTLLSGLYKVSPKYSEINITLDGMYKLRAKLLTTTTQAYSKTEANYIYIMSYYNNIKIFNTVGGIPIIDYTDTENPFLDGSFGLQVTKQADVNFTDMEILY